MQLVKADNKNHRSIFTIGLANYLVREGYQIYKIVPNRDNPEKAVFIFKNEDTLLDAIKRYSDNLER